MASGGTIESSAILIAPRGTSGPLRGLMDRLVAVNVAVMIVDDLDTAVDLAARNPSPPALLLDLRELTSEVEDLQRASGDIRRVIARVPLAQPVCVTNDADGRLIVACIRAGAGDVIDLALEGTATARAVVQRICQRQRERARELELAQQQRALTEELVRDLVRTERRTIDVEEALAVARSGGAGTATESRPATVLLVEHERGLADELADRLETAGVATFAYATGEEALREARALATSTGLDLALVAAQLPGLDGLETVRRLREDVAGLPAFLLTSAHDADLAAHAADLGVVGFVGKPVVDLDALVERLVGLARESLNRTREKVYLDRIKERHERVLGRYHALRDGKS